MATPGHTTTIPESLPLQTPPNLLKFGTHTYIASPTSIHAFSQQLVDEVRSGSLNDLLGCLERPNEDPKPDLRKEMKNSTTWSSTIKTKPASAGSEELFYCIPTVSNGVLQLDDSLCEEGAKEWENTIVGYFLDKKLPFSMVKSMVEKKWKLKGVMEMMLDGDLFYFNFSEFEDREAILDDGAFHLLGKLFIISPWSRDIEDNRGQISKIPLWVNLYKVPKYLWNSKGLSFIASMVGKPLFMDKNTESKKLLSYARVCIEIDAEKELPNSIPIETSTGKSFIIGVEYVWKPLICTSCKTFGHSNGRCNIHPTTQRLEKGEVWTEARKSWRKKGHNMATPSMVATKILARNENGKETTSAVATSLPIQNSFNILNEEISNDLELEEISDKVTLDDGSDGKMPMSKKKRNHTHPTIENDCPPGFEGLSKQQHHLTKMSKVASSLIGVESEVNQENFVKYLVVPFAKEMGLTGMSIEGQEKLFGDLLKSNTRNPD